MEEIIFNQIKQNIGCNQAAEDAQIRVTNLKLKQDGFSPLPDEFIALLKFANGLSNDDVRIFGAELKDLTYFDDLVTFNRQFFHQQSANWLILGRDDNFYLIYVPSLQAYQLVDQDTLQPEISSKSLEKPLLSFLRI